MKILKIGTAIAALMLSIQVDGSVAQAAEKCPVLIGPDWSGETLSPDPARLLSISDVYHARMVYEPFVAADSTMQPIPWLAESWESNDKATEWTFKVRQGVKFHDGSPLTADDVVYTFRRLLDPKTESAGASELGAIKPDAFKSVDANTVKVTLESPIAELPSILATKHGMVVKNGASSEDIRLRPNGTGPFTLKELKLGLLKTTFTKNADYWRQGLPKSDCLTVTAITEPLSRIAALQSGEADVVLVVDPATISAVKADPNITLTKAPGGTAVTIGMWIDTPPFDNPKVRQAMKLVIDRQAIVDTALLGFGVPGNDNPIMPASPDAYRPDVMQRDVAKAKQLLTEAGHPDGISVDLHAADLMPGTMAMVQAYQQMASEAGIKVNIVNESAGEYWDTIWLKKAFSVSNWGMRTTPAALSVAYRKAAPWNETHWFSDKYDGLLDEAAKTIDADARRKLYQEAQRMLAEDGGVLIPMFANIVAATRKGCSGYTPASDHNRPDFTEIVCEN
ncbi:MAG TPA: ABC transporter substrate-binding protein [Aestuariivirga sp.]|nr:ABC transporter substrate-binding protein [Aestuariivirga sp.]